MWAEKGSYSCLSSQGKYFLPISLGKRTHLLISLPHKGLPNLWGTNWCFTIYVYMSQDPLKSNLRLS